MARNTDQKCPDCGGTQFVEDHAQGDVVCKGCGLVVEAHIIDERSEWRTFSDKDKESTDPNRVGGPNNPLLEGGGLTTVIGKGRDGDGSYALNRLHTRNNNPDRALVTAFKMLGDLSEKLGLPQSVKNSACEIYKKAMESGRLRGRSSQAIGAACMYLAARQNNTPRSFKEITAVLASDVQKKDIGRCFKEVMNVMKEAGLAATNPATATAQLAPVSQHPADYMKRFCAALRLDHSMFKACRDMALAAKPKEGNNAAAAANYPWDSRSPLSIAAGILYVLTMIKQSITLQDIYSVTNVAIVTIKTVYKDFYPYLRQLLPPGFNSEEQIARLPQPDSRTDH